jgi:hypothetical protein
VTSSAPLTTALDAVRRNPLRWICLLALAASITSLTNGFALDDVHLIVDNDSVHSIARAWEVFGQTYWPAAFGSSLYRPLTMLAFSIEWALGGGSPLPFHAASIVLYVLVCVTLYRFVRQLADNDVAILSTALFAIHPVHTEAVANVVGQGELLAAMFVFLAMERYVRARRSGAPGPVDALAVGFFYALGLLSKEHAVVLPALLLSAELLIVSQKETIRDRLKRFAPAFAVMVVVAIAFIAVRTMVTGGLRAAGTNEILGGASFGVRVMTMLDVVVEWIRLFLWPADLSADYSFPRTRVATAPDAGMIPGILVIVGCAVLAWRMRRTKPVITFGILWIAITMAIPSNLVMVTGFVLAERTLFLPSAGVVLIVAAVAIGLWHRIDVSERTPRRVIAVAGALVVVLGIVRSATRNPAWRDNETLFRQTVEDVPYSSRAHWMLSEHLSKTNRQRAAADEMMLAVALGRKDDVLLLGAAADQFQVTNMCGRAMPLYRRALELTPQNEQLRANASLCLMKLGRIDEARALAVSGFAINRASPALNRTVALADSLSREERVRQGGAAR